MAKAYPSPQSLANLKPAKPGEVRNPTGINGRMTGRGLALEQLDAVLANPEKLAKMKAAFEDAIDKDPLRFWREIIQANLPKEVRGEMAIAFSRIVLDAAEEAIEDIKADVEAPGAPGAPGASGSELGGS